MKIKLLILLLISTLSFSAQNLPHYKLIIAPADLDSMNAHPKDETYYSAIFQVDTFRYTVQARYKGSTSLNFPKKSWAIKFDNTNNYFGVTRINLHADYKDNSKMRNFLIMKLFAQLGSPASQIQHVTYEVNGKSYGVFTKVEQINSEYLARNGRLPISLYKANNHGALMAPTVRDDYYSNIWGIETGGDPTYNELRTLFNKCFYLSKADFNTQIGDVIDVDNFLNFFAVHFVFVGLDNFTKNIFLNKNSESAKYELLPWDNEGSFGNTAYGVFDYSSVSYNMRDAFTPEYQVVLQRLLENPTYKSLFQTKVNRILNDGFSYMDTLIDNTYLKIKQDIYADTMKESTNEDFDNSIPRLKWFMANRKTFLQNNDLPTRNALTNFYCSNPFPNATNSVVTLRITSPAVQDVNVFFADSVNYDSFGHPFKMVRVQLFDDGLHDDLLANDLVYGNIINTNDYMSTLVPFSFTGAEQNYPSNGIFYMDYYRSKSYALNKGNVDSDVASRVKFGEIFQYDKKNFVEIINTSSTLTADLSYCHLRTDNSTNDFMFRDQVVLEPNETIYVAPTSELGNQFFPGKRSFFTLPYALATGDSLHLLSPVLSAMTSIKLNTLQAFSLETPILVINEINYKSGTAKSMGDWVEIHNPGTTAINMTDWIFKDGDNKHAFQFPNGYTLPADGYVVIAENAATFHAACPDVTNYVGSTGFGLSSTGEYVRLFDNFGQLVDSVNYSATSPWPTEAAGEGATIELKNASFDNTIATSWYADALKNGSPGQPNSITTVIPEIQSITYSIYPNPTSSSLYIHTNAENAYVELITLQGCVIRTMMIHSHGENRMDVNQLPRGMYLVRVSNGDKQQTEKVIIR